MASLVLFVSESIYTSAAVEYLQSRPDGHTVMAINDSMAALVDNCRSLKPDAVVFFAAPPDLKLNAAMKDIREASPGIRFIAVQNRQCSPEDNQRLARQADTVISDRNDPQLLMSAIVITLSGYDIKPKPGF